MLVIYIYMNISQVYITSIQSSEMEDKRIITILQKGLGGAEG